LRREPDFFGETDLSLVYIAKKLKQALALEQLLSAYSIDYLVEPDTYRGGLIFASERVGAFFYVAPESEAATKDILLKNGYEPYQHA
jgi:prenyltransferase beta subunit